MIKKNYKNTVTNFPPSTREWNNSIYTFDKNYLNLLTDKSKLTMKLIKSYFNLYNNKLESKLRKSNLRIRFRRLSSNKVYVSNGSFKHTNDKVIITIYVYNKQKINYTYLIRRKFRKFLTKKMTRNLLFIRHKVQEFIEKEIKNVLIVNNIINNGKSTHNYVIKNILSYMLYTKLVNTIFKKYKKHLLYKQLLFINRSKFNFNYLTYLQECLYEIYNKKVQFNIISLKNFYSNSDIFTESLLLKIKSDRRKLVKKLKKLIIKSKITKTNKYLSYVPATKNILNLDGEKNFVNNLILNNSYKNRKTIKGTVLGLTKYKRVTGVRIKAQGRLTKRYTASRSLSKLRYKGNLWNVDSSYFGFPSVILRGNLRSNLQYTKLSSKTRIGSFGLKGWVNSY